MIMVLRVLDTAVSKYLIINSTVFPLQNICKYIWLSPDGKSAGDKWIGEFKEG